MSVTLDCTSAPFVQCGKKLKLSSDGGDSGSKKRKRGYGGAYGGVWRTLRLVGVWNQASAALKNSSHLIYSLKKFYKCCTFNAICKDSAAINCITVQHEKGSLP
jgi:hypothetical protein